MAVLEEQVSEMCVRHYSDKGLRLRQVETGILYDDAVDMISCRFLYKKTNEPINIEPINGSEALRIITGGII